MVSERMHRTISKWSRVRLKISWLPSRANNGFGHTDHQRRMGPPSRRQALCIAVEFHSCFHEVLVDGGENSTQGVECRVEEHDMRLDLEGTVSPRLAP